MTTNPFRQRHTGPTINPFTGKPNPVPDGVGEGPPDTPDSRASASVTSTAGAAGSASVAEGADADHVEALVARAREIKAEQSRLSDELAQIKTELWDAAGHKYVKLPGGAAFRKGSTLTPKRRVDYKTLEHQFPEAYHATVTVTEPDPDAPGALYLHAQGDDAK